MKMFINKILLLLTVVIIVSLSSCNPGEEEPFSAAEFETFDATNVTFSKATLNGELTSGSQKIIDCGFVWGKVSLPLLGSAEEKHFGEQDEDQSFNHTLNDIESNTTYYYRTFIVLKSKTIYGDEQSFHTGQDAVFNAMDAADILYTEALILGNLIRLDGKIFDCGFVWGENPNPTTTTADVKSFGPQEEDKILSHKLTGLTIDKKYYFRTFITTEAGTQYSEDLNFSTLAPLIWTDPSPFPGPGRMSGVTFVIGTKAYVGLGHTRDAEGRLVLLDDLWEFNMLSNTWTEKKKFPNGGRTGAIGFSVNGKGYAGTGATTAGATKDFWEYNPTTNQWIQKADYLGGDVGWASSFSLQNKGYVGTGVNNESGNFLKTFYEYNPETNQWTKKADFSGPAIDQAVSFTIGENGYIGLGLTQSSGASEELWAYSPANDTWTKKKNCPTTKEMYGSFSFALNNKAYMSHGWGSENIVWAYDPATDDWTQGVAISGSVRVGGLAFVTNDKAIIGTGAVGSSYSNTFIKYIP